MYKKVHPSEPVNKGYPINPFPLPKNFMCNGKLKKAAGSGSSLDINGFYMQILICGQIEVVLQFHGDPLF